MSSRRWNPAFESHRTPVPDQPDQSEFDDEDDGSPDQPRSLWGDSAQRPSARERRDAAELARYDQERRRDHRSGDDSGRDYRGRDDRERYESSASFGSDRGWGQRDRVGDRYRDERPPKPLEPPLWEQWAQRGQAIAPSGEKLHKVLARLGIASRRECEEMIEAGRVRVNGKVARTGRRVDETTDQLEVDGVRVGERPGLVYVLLNKPLGVVTTASDPQGRETVVDLVDHETRVFPVGRLDYDTEGLLVLTNDGELTHRLTHPSFGVTKEYLATVNGTPSRNAVNRLRRGVELDDGMTAPADVSVVGTNVLRIVIHEGRNRQVRRMCEAVGHPVEALQRTRFGPLRDPALAPGAWRELTTHEVHELERAANAAANSVGADDESIGDESTSGDREPWS
jgi:23S rRNA pseudouridine2605 synthase